MAYYISFLKTLSFRLNKHTIHFFYNEVSPERSDLERAEWVVVVPLFVVPRTLG